MLTQVLALVLTQQLQILISIEEAKSKLNFSQDKYIFLCLLYITVTGRKIYYSAAWISHAVVGHYIYCNKIMWKEMLQK